MLSILLNSSISLLSQDNSFSYIPIIIQFIVVCGVISLMIFGTHALGPNRFSKKKLENFECGIEKQGNARQPLAIKYFLVAILFVLFDVEVIFFYPYAINFKKLGQEGLIAILMFVALFLIGYLYIIRTKALEWED